MFMFSNHVFLCYLCQGVDLFGFGCCMFDSVSRSALLVLYLVFTSVLVVWENKVMFKKCQQRDTLKTVYFTVSFFKELFYITYNYIQLMIHLFKYQSYHIQQNQKVQHRTKTNMHFHSQGPFRKCSICQA